MNRVKEILRSPMGRCAAAVSITLMASACAVPTQYRSGFLKDYSALRTSNHENVLLYRSPTFEPKLYSKVALEQSLITGDTPELRALKPELRQDILAHIDKELVQRVQVGGIAEPSGGRTMRVRAAISEVETPNLTVNWATTILIGAVTRGGAALEVELSDASTGEVLLAATCSERAHPMWDQLEAYSLLGHARLAITECMKRFEQAYAATK